MASGDRNNHQSLSSYINLLKSSISKWEDITLQSQKLNHNLKLTGQNVNAIIESLVSLSNMDENSKYSGLYEVGNLLSDISIREKYIADKVFMLNNTIQNNFVINLSFHIENWKRSIANIKRERELDRKRAKIDMKKAISELSKLESKKNRRITSNRNSMVDTVSLQMEYSKLNLQSKKQFVEELERCSLKKALCEERNRFKQLLECLRPVLDAQLAIKNDLEELQLIYDKLYSSSAEDLGSLPADIDAYVKQYQVVESSRVNSVSSLYSRANSQLSLSGSHCSSIENSLTMPTYCQMLNSSCSPSEFPNEDKKLDISSSTVIDINANSSQYSMPEKNESDDESSSNDDILEQKSLSNVTEESLYPNQAIPPPRYSNLRELKQIADKKYGSTSMLRDKTDSINGDCTNNNRSSLFVNNMHHYSDNMDYSQNHFYKDNDGYASIYDTFSDVSDNTSTFKRRKPRIVTAIEIPKINNDRNHQNRMRSTVVVRNHRSYSMDRNSTEISHVCGSVEKTNLGLRLLPPNKTGRILNTCNSMYLGDMVMVQSDTGMYASQNQLQQRITDNNFNCKNSLNNDTHFKQQLLKVIQGDRTLLQKSVSVTSSQMF